MPRRSVLQFGTRTILMLMLVVGLGAIWAKYRFFNSYSKRPPLELTLPIETVIEKLPNGDLSSNLIAYARGNYGIYEFGKIRLAIDGIGSASWGRSQSRSIILSSKGKPSRGGSVGRFQFIGMQGGSNCTIGDLSFDVTNGDLHILGDKYPVAGPPQLIVIGERGRIDTHMEIESSD